MYIRLLSFSFTLILFVHASGQTPASVVISQVYGGGGLTNAPFANDFVELYNPTGADIEISGWSLQYAAATGNFSAANQVNLSGRIASGKYFLVQLSGGSNGVALPAPDQASTAINLNAGSGKIALVNSTNLIASNCSSQSAIVDFVGYGSANCREGGSGNEAPGISNTTAVHRINNGCTDTDNNKADFFEQAPSPRNSGSLRHVCGIPITISTVLPLPFCVNLTQGTSGTLTYSSSTTLSGVIKAFLSDVSGSYFNETEVGSGSANGNTGSIDISIPANIASGEAYYLRLYAEAMQVYSQQSAKLEVINGAKNVGFQQAFPDENEIMVQWTYPSGCFEEFMVVCREGNAVTGAPSGDGSVYIADASFTGNGTDFNGGKVVYRGTGLRQLVTGLTFDKTYHFMIFTRRGINWSSGVQANVATRIIPKPGEVLINALSTRYAGASDEYVELVNTTGKSFNLSDLNLSYQNNLGQDRVPVGLTGTLGAHSFWFLASSNTVTVGKTLELARDGSRGSSFADNAYLGITRKKDNLIVDAVGFGSVSGGTLIEGSPAPAIPSTGGGLMRKVDGVDTDQNSTDFVLIVPSDIDLRNSQSRLANNGAEIGASSLSRLYVTGAAKLTGNVTINEKLVLQGGKLSLGAYDVALSAIEGGTASSFIQTEGSGSVQVLNSGSGPIFIPVGHTTFNPLKLQAASNSKWYVSVTDGVVAGNSDGAVQRTWNITPADIANTPTATLVFHYNEADPNQLGPLFDGADKVQVYNLHNGTWQKAGDPQDPGGMAGGMRTATLNNWSRFSPFVVSTAGAAGVLPIKFTGLRVFQRSNDMVLAFTVHSEVGVEHYEVESSPDGLNFERQALIMPRNNRGATVQYEFADRRPLAGNRYYRVRALEQNGSTSFSAVVMVRGKMKSPVLTIAPNPVINGTVQYAVANLAAGNYQVRVINSLGQVVVQTKLIHSGGWVSGTLVLPKLGSGWYMLDLAGPLNMKQQFLVR